MNALVEIARALTTLGKGLQVTDERVDTCNRRRLQTSEPRRRLRELLLKTAGQSEAVSGAILVDENIR